MIDIFDEQTDIARYVNQRKNIFRLHIFIALKLGNEREKIILHKHIYNVA